jgi:N-acetylmuramoyl-L-alanine amidase
VKIVLSSGHGSLIRGASGLIDEVDEARKVVEHVADYLSDLGVDVTTYHDDISDDQQENLNRIVDFHNSQTRDRDVSIHFNAYEPTSKPMGTECLYVSDEETASNLARAMAESAEFVNRGPKFRDDLFFLNQTEQPGSMLLEVCFVDSTADVDMYMLHFDDLCEAIALTLAGGYPPAMVVEVKFEGTCSWFGGPDDTGVAPDEGLAFIYEADAAPHLFLPVQPQGTTGLARRLNPEVYYVACRWDYDITPKTMLDDPDKRALVIAKRTKRMALAWPADWGPHEEKTGRAADLSPGLMEHLRIETDDEVIVIYPAPKEYNGDPIS